MDLGQNTRSRRSRSRSAVAESTELLRGSAPPPSRSGASALGLGQKGLFLCEALEKRVNFLPETRHWLHRVARGGGEIP